MNDFGLKIGKKRAAQSRYPCPSNASLPPSFPASPSFSLLSGPLPAAR